MDSVVCHCRTCRKASAAPLVPWVTFPSDRFRFVRGSPAEFRSSASVIRTFCSSCGTPLTHQRIDLQSQIDVTACSLKDPERFPASHHSWTGHDAAEIGTADGSPLREEIGQDV